MKPKPYVGMELFSLNVGNAAGRYREQKLTPVEVTQVGRKYFTCKTELGRELIYHIGTWAQKSEYIATSVLYADPQEWEDEKESRNICTEIYKAFDYGHNSKKLPLSKLREIKAIIDRLEE